ncbi:class I SAM-dependent methyltransferase [candidate division KSB1 bacterium]|nr:class I SAM-dependent methyltransferase [candidate division KSB1 bacterium]
MSTDCHGDVLLTKEGHQIINCERCGYIHVFPLYSEEELEIFYENVYAESTPSYLWHEKVYNIRKWKKNGTILDIGCWEGNQLEFFQKDGWQCVGIELNKKAATIAASKGIEVYQISIRQFFDKFPQRKWDVINAAYILEHIPDPVGFLVRLKNNLEPKGIIIVELPNEFNPFQLAYIKEYKLLPYWIALPDHLNYFDKRGIENLLQRAGFEVIHGETSFPMEMFLLMGDNYLQDRSLGKHCFGKVVEMERILRQYDPGLLSELYASLYRCGIGRSMVIYAQVSDRR